MQAHSESRIVPYAADLMYRIVADVERYPEFLPWVIGTAITQRESDTVFHVEMRVGFSGLRERYVSRVVADPRTCTVDVAQIEGPFRWLESHWHFTPRERGCLVEFSIDFEFNSGILNAVAGRAFQFAMVKMADAFEARARAITEHSAQTGR